MEIAKIECGSVHYKHFAAYDSYPGFVPCFADRRCSFYVGGRKYPCCYRRIATIYYLREKP